MRTHASLNASDKLNEIRNHYADQAARTRLEGVVDVLNDMLSSKHDQHRFRMASDANSVLLFDSETDEVIREVAIEELIQIVTH